MTRAFSLACVVFLVLATGCTRNHYVVEITPDGEHYQRKLIAWHDGPSEDSDISSLPEEEFRRIDRLYGGQGRGKEGNKDVFTGRFRGNTPGDVGGAGSYTYFTSSLGTLTIYVERFRGNDDVNAELSKRRAAADTLIDLLIGWFKSEMGECPSCDRVKAFLDKELRNDIKNVGLYALTHEAVSAYQGDVNEDFVVRVWQYFAERGYCSFCDLPKLYWAFQQQTDDQLALFIQRLVARKIGVKDSEPIPKSLSFLGDPKRMKASLSKYLRGTEFYRQRVADWRAKQQDDPDSDEQCPKPLDVFKSLVMNATLWFELSAFDAVEVRLHTAVEPFVTNGKWDAESKTTKWNDTLGKHRALPMLVHAAWSNPNRQAQEDHFGKIVLQGENLGQYIAWYRGLPAKETAQWDAFLSKLKPDNDLGETVKSFRFTTDAPLKPDLPEDEQPASAADAPRRLILNSLEQEEQKE